MMVVDIWSPACKHWPTVLHSMTTNAESADLSQVVFVTINLGNVAEAVRLITEHDINPAHSRVSMSPSFALFSTQNVHWGTHSIYACLLINSNDFYYTLRPLWFIST